MRSCYQTLLSRFQQYSLKMSTGIGPVTLLWLCAPLQALRLQTTMVHSTPDMDFAHTELVSKYGIMFSMDVFPHKSSSDSKKLDPNDFSSMQLNQWTSDELTSLELLSTGHGKNVTDLHAQSLMHGTTVIHHNMYARGINDDNLKNKPATVYVVASALPAFIKKVMPHVRKPFVLVTGDAYLQAPDQLFDRHQTSKSFEKFIGNPLILHWFAQNGNSDHPKFSRIPNGLDYHSLALKVKGKHQQWGMSHATPQEQESMLKDIRDQAPQFSSRNAKILASFTMRPERVAVYQALQKTNVSQFRPSFDTREDFWKLTAATKYVASPNGAGWDCHRTWETIALGSVPVVSHTGMSKLFTGHNLPVHIVKEWSELEYLKESDLEAKLGTHDKGVPPAMKLQYWVDLINSKALPTEAQA